MREDTSLSIHVECIEVHAHVMRERRFQTRVTGTDVQRIGVVSNRQQVFHARVAGTSTIREAQLSLLLRLVAEIHFWREVEHITCCIYLIFALLIRQFGILWSESYTSRQSPGVYIHTEGYTSIVIKLLILCILALFRVNPRLIEIVWKNAKNKIHSILSIHQVVSRVIAFAITVLETIAELQVHSISQRFAIADFRTQIVICGRSRDITTNGVFRKCRNTITTHIITSQVVRVLIAFIVSIATNQTQGYITSSIVQLTCYLHVTIGRQRVTL